MSGKTRQIAGLLITALLSMIVLTIFYGNLLGKLNQVSFASGGDGLQSYINMEYHIRYDTTYLRCNSMNYPYGEHVFFTNNQPLISNTVKFISQNITDISGYTLGILNFLMLFCLVITPVILYLIFDHLGVGSFMAVIASLGIAYLSPQLDRFGGHFNLSYVCTIPFMILLLLKFFRKPTALMSLLIFLTILAGALTHFYIYGFYALLLLFFYGAFLIKDSAVFRNKITLAIHFFVQLVLPFLILQAFYLSDQVTDRPSYPWGFLHYRAYPQSVFLPLGRPYGQFLHTFLNTSYIDWEGYAFIGMVAFIGTMVFLIRLVQKITLKQYTQTWQVTTDRNLNLLFWASFAGLLYSFGLPFILGLQWLVDLIGPIRQMRGIARFSWLFFYVMNVVTFYWLWTWWKTNDKKMLKTGIIAAALIMLSIDAWYNVRNRGKWLENNIPVLTDSQLKLRENQWIRRIDLTCYQAIIPLPYFHVGSENIWIDGGCDVITQSFIAIKNSGLPCMGVMLSRTSLSQTLENVGLMLGSPYSAYNMGRFPSQKPFLIMAARCELQNDFERQLIEHATHIDSSGVFDIYALPFNSFREMADSAASVVTREYQSLKMFGYHGLYSPDSVINFRYVNYDSLGNNPTMNGAGCYIGKAKNKNELFSGFIPHADTAKTVVISFWMDHVSGDLYPRTRVDLTESDLLGNHVNSLSQSLFKRSVMIHSDQVLVEFRYKMSDPLNRLTLTVRNKELRNNKILIDDLLLRMETADVYLLDKKSIMKNNRRYHLRNEAIK